jgi:hypothetical protein
MDPQPRKCLRCEGTLQEGFIPDTGVAASGFAKWHADPPKFDKFWGLQAASHNMKPIAAYRCDQCGTLELVAK